MHAYASTLLFVQYFRLLSGDVAPESANYTAYNHNNNNGGTLCFEKGKRFPTTQHSGKLLNNGAKTLKFFDLANFNIILNFTILFHVKQNYLMYLDKLTKNLYINSKSNDIKYRLINNILRGIVLREIK